MKKNSKILLTLSVVLFAITGSCNIGLGAAVDVKAPTVEINYPPEGSTIMDTFVLAGICDDDSYVDKVRVELVNASETEAGKTYSYENKVEGKTWQVNINNFKDGKYELPDGKWTANVKVIDSAGRESGIVSRSFDIDNTPPELMLSNPNTVGDASNPISFGAIIQIKGEITETHNTSNLRFYYQKVDASGNLTGDMEYIDCGEVSSLSSDTPFVIARNYSDTEANTDTLKKLQENYKKIHSLNFIQPETGDIDQKVYCAIELYDSALTYKNPDLLNDTGAGVGNVSKKYTVKNVKDPVVTDGEKKITLNSSCFILNSDNAPRYAISDYVFDPNGATSSDKFKKLATGTKINLTVSAGKDNSIVKPKSVKVSLQEINSDGTNKDPIPDPITILERGTWDDTDDDIKISKGIDIEKEMGLKQDCYYKILIEALDRNNVDAVAESGKVFAFHFDSSSLPPEVKISNIFKQADKAQRNEADPATQILHDVKLSGNDLKAGIYIPVTVDTNGVKLNRSDDTLISEVIKIYQKRDEVSMPEGIRVKNGKGEEISDANVKYFYPSSKKFSEVSATESTFQNFTYSEGIINFELKLDHNNVDVDPDKYTYSFIVKVQGNTDTPRSAEKEVSFTIDSKNPEVSNISVTPIVKGAAPSADTVNGKVTFEASVKDNFELYDTAYKVTGVKSDSTEVVVASKEFSTTAPSAADFEITLDTYNNYSQKGYNKFRVYLKAKDSVGNIYNDYSKAGVTPVYYEYVIDQTKDTPVIETVNFNTQSGTTDVFENTRTLSLSVTDDDGIGSVKYKFDSGAEQTVFLKDKDGKNVPPSNGKPFDIALTGLASGLHTITVTAVDSKNETENYATATLSAVSFAIDNEVPTISETAKIGNETAKFSNELTEASGTYQGKIVLPLIVNDDWGVASVTCAKENGTAYSTSEVSFTTDWKAIITPATTNGVYTYVFTVTDKAGKAATLKRNICVDITPPTFKAAQINTAKSHTGGLWYNKTSLEIQGTATDENGIKSVEYSLDGGSTYKDSLPITGTDSSNVTTFKGFVLEASNNKNITLKIIDNAGNETKVTPTALSGLHIDTEGPETVSLESEAGDKFSNGTAKYTIKIKAIDNPSGIQKVDLVLKSTGAADDVKTITATPVNNVYTYTDYPAVAGDLYARATDNADNVTEKLLFKIDTDTEKPKAEIKEVKYEASGALLSKNANGEYVDANKNIVISGIASDNKQLASVTLQYYKNSTWNNYDTITDGDLNNWSFVVNTTDTSKFTDKTSTQFKIIAADRAGNSGNSETTESKIQKTVNINQDSDRPVIKITNFDLSSMANTTAGRVKLISQKRVNFTVTDDDDVKKVEVKIHKVNENEDIDYADCTAKGYIDIPSDGPCNLSFKVTDGADTEFTSDTTTITSSPKIKGNTGDTTFGVTGKTDTNVYLVVDNEGPSVKEIKFASKKEADTNYSSDQTSTTAITIGGDYNTVKITLKLQDANGISEVTLKKGTTLVDSNTYQTEGTLSRTYSTITYVIKGLKVPVDAATTNYTLTFKDCEGNANTESFTIYADSEAPVLSVDSHLENQVVGSVFTLKGKIDGIDSGTTVKYLIDTAETRADNYTGWSSAVTLKDASAGYSSWRMFIDGDTNNPDGYTHEKSHKELIRDLYGAKLKGGVLYTDTSYSVKYTTINPVYFHFLVTDAVGNQSVKNFKLRIDPQGDIPTVQIVYPSTGKTLTGKIRVQGTSSVYQDNKIAGIYMQIDPKMTGAESPKVYTPSFTAWKGTNTTSVPDVKATDGTTSLSSKLDSKNPIEYIFSRCSPVPDSSTIETAYKNLYGIYVGNKANWDIVINNDKELADVDSQGESIANHIALRMYIVDDHGNVNIVETSEYTELIIDSDVPAIGKSQEFSAYQFAWKASSGAVLYTNTPEPAAGGKAYTDSGCRNGETSITSVTATTITVSGTTYTKDFNVTPYSKNMWLKGEWWLCGSVEDNSGVKTVNITSANGTTDLVKEGAISSKAEASAVEKEYSCEKNSDYLIAFRVGVPDSNKTAGELTYKVFIEENEINANLKASEEIFYVNYDNKVPVAKDLTLKNNGTITNSFGFYELSSTAEEKGTQSGFARTVVYFTRNTTASATTIYDPYIRAKQTGNAQSYSGMHYEDGIYWVEKTVSSVSNKDITINSASANIHKGALVKLNGAYYKIEEIDGTTITLDEAPGSSAATSSVYFALGIVIDMESEAEGSTFLSTTEGYGYYDIEDNDDFIVESSITTNGVTEWKGSINSNNIPDGPINVHYVVYDKAGNFSAVQTATGKVANNALRITGVKVWCDYNENNQPDEDKDEVVSYYNEEIDVKIDDVMTTRAGAFTTDLSIDSSLMTVKGTTYVYPEFIGGNGMILESHTYPGASATAYANFVNGNEGNDYSGIDEEADDAGYYRKDEQGAGIGYYQGSTGYKPGINSSTGTAYALETTQKFVLTTTQLGADGTDKPFVFNFKDSTDGGSNTAKISFKLSVACEDDEDPSVAFGPFQYDAAKKTKAQRKVTTGVPYSHIKDMDLTQGHVETTADWTKVDTAGNKLTGWDGKAAHQSTQFDSDPKVSGKVTVRGTVSDNMRVDKIYLWPIGGAAYTQVAHFAGGEIVLDNTTYKYNSTTGIGFEVEAEQNDQNGHTVFWAYTFDSSSVNANKVAVDAVIKVKAVDNSSTTDDAEETFYMDIVPYITKISTPLDIKNPNNPSAFSRTSLGHYPLYAMTKGFNNGERVGDQDRNGYFTFEGFNITSGNIVSVTAASDNTKVFDQDATDKFKFTLNDSTISGAYVVTVTGGIQTLNNSNLNTAKYNMQPNNLNNNILTDDVVFDIWDINSKAATGPNGTIDDPVMKINPNNGVIGFAFANGAERFCMPDSTGSYKKSSRSYDVMKHNALTYDVSGNSYAVSVGGDIDEKSDSSNTADGMTFMTSRWNNAVVGDNQNSNRDATSDNRLRLESIGLNKGNNVYEKSKDRFLSQSMATYATENQGKTTTYIYLAYYDDLLQQVKVKAGVTDGTKGNFQNFVDAGANSRTEAQANNVQVIAQNTSSSSAIAKADTLGDAGKFVSIATTTNNNVVLVWYDGTDLKYTYTTRSLVFQATEKSGNQTKTANIAQRGGVKNPSYPDNSRNYTWQNKRTGSDWANASTVFSGFGQYCKVAVDANNGVHVVAFDPINRRLHYAYSSSYTTVPTATYVVDAYSNVGKYLTLDVAKKGNYYVPYIGYWDNTLQLPRYAYLAKPENFQGANAATAEKNGYILEGDDTGYTGVWDCTPVPTLSKIKQGTINIGVWKNKTGLSSNCAGTITTSTGTYTSSTTGNSGTCYGNGSSNGVLGYLINADSTTYIETAQIR